jgi:hypothetical protein
MGQFLAEFNTVAVLSHELGHIECGHLKKDGLGRDPHLRELEADRYAGSAMRLLGYPMEEALSYVSLLSKQPSGSHPSRSEREQAIRAGWSDPSFANKCTERTRKLIGSD